VYTKTIFLLSFVLPSLPVLVNLIKLYVCREKGASLSATIGGTKPQCRSSQKRQRDTQPLSLVDEPVSPVEKTVLPHFEEGANQQFNDTVDLSALPADL